MNISHVEQHEQADAGPNAEDIIGDEEGEVGDGDEEEGGDECGDDGALHPPGQVQLKPKVGVVGRVLACLILFHLGAWIRKWQGKICVQYCEYGDCVIRIDGVTYYAKSVEVAWQVNIRVDHKRVLIPPFKFHLLRGLRLLRISYFCNAAQ